MKLNKCALTIAATFIVLTFLIACQNPVSVSQTDASIVSPVSSSSLAQSGGAVYYVRPDGGSVQQCTGLKDAAFPGSGSGQPCAWNHPFQALPPGGEPQINGGDTLIIRKGSYKMGFGAPGAENCEYEGSYDCSMLSIPSGRDASHPTRILGEGWDAGCSAPPELWGSGRPFFIINMKGSSNVQVSCLEVTDHSSCIEDHSPNKKSPYTCQRDTPPYGDWAANGLYAEDSKNVILKDLNIHGLANTGMLVGRLTDWTLENVRLVGNGLAGWNSDLVGDGSQSENHGTFTFKHWTVEWNGCGETYPDLKHVGCWGQEAGGYGDGAGFGGTTGGHYIIEDSSFSFNTSDGLDMLYVRLPDSLIEIRRVISAMNDGNQIKTSGNVTIENSIIVSQCGYFHGMPYWNNDDDCRAAGDALVFALNPGGQAKLTNSTVTGNGNCLLTTECALDKKCNGKEKVLAVNNIFQGQKVYWSPGDDTCFAWYDDESSSPMPANPIAVAYSLITSVRYGNVTPCPGSNNLCDVNSGLVNTDINKFDVHLTANSPAVNAGTSNGAPLVDFDGRPRDSRPDMGAYER